MEPPCATDKIKRGAGIIHLSKALSCRPGQFRPPNDAVNRGMTPHHLSFYAFIGNLGDTVSSAAALQHASIQSGVRTPAYAGQMLRMAGKAWP
ncbi:hypothetical protein MTO96_021974 [Rhipicephalus appendiculatus]